LVFAAVINLAKGLMLCLIWK